MIDLTPLFEALLGIALAIITGFLIPWLNARYGNEKMAKIRDWVHVAVFAAEKAYGAGRGDEKLAFAEQFLAEHKIKLDLTTLKAMVDAEIKAMEQAEAYVLIEPPAAE